MKRANSSIIVNAIPYTHFCGTLKFALPPRLHDNVWKAIFMSATQDETLFKRAFPEAHPQNLPSTAWQPHVKVYQLRTNRNPRAAVYRFADGEAVGLSDTGENYWQRMIDEIARTPDTKHAIITYKDVLKWKLNDEASDLSELDNIIATAHYGNHRVGFDTDFQDPDHLCILFAPELPITKLYGEEACLFSLAMFLLGVFAWAFLRIA